MPSKELEDLKDKLKDINEKTGNNLVVFTRNEIWEFFKNIECEDVIFKSWVEYFKRNSVEDINMGMKIFEIIKSYNISNKNYILEKILDNLREIIDKKIKRNIKWGISSYNGNKNSVYLCTDKFKRKGFNYEFIIHLLVNSISINLYTGRDEATKKQLRKFIENQKELLKHWRLKSRRNTCASLILKEHKNKIGVKDLGDEVSKGIGDLIKILDNREQNK